MTECYLKYLRNWHPAMTPEDKFLGFSEGEIKGPMLLDNALFIMGMGKSDQWELLRITTPGEVRIIEGHAHSEHLRQFIQEKYPAIYDSLYNSKSN